MVHLYEYSPHFLSTHAVFMKTQVYVRDFNWATKLLVAQS